MRRRTALIALVVAAALASVAGLQLSSGPAAAAAPSCQLGNGVQHVINIVFDNVHFSRDNPNVPSDLEQMPHLLNFLKTYGTVFSNSHTPMIAHTADDSLSIYTGLYGDRHGQPLTNSYKTYNPDGTTDPATSFTYWTSPIIDTKTNPPVREHDRHADDAVLGMASRGRERRHAGAVGAVHARGLHGRRLLDREHGARERDRRRPDGVRRELARGDADRRRTRTRSRTPRSPQYVGEAIHCAQGDTICANSSRPVADSLPTEPGGYNGYQALFGAKYIAPAIGGGPNHFNAQRLPGHRREREPRRRSTGTPSPSRSAVRRASPGSARRRRRASP